MGLLGQLLQAGVEGLRLLRLCLCQLRRPRFHRLLPRDELSLPLLRGLRRSLGRRLGRSHLPALVQHGLCLCVQASLHRRHLRCPVLHRLALRLQTRSNALGVRLCLRQRRLLLRRRPHGGGLLFRGLSGGGCTRVSCSGTVGGGGCRIRLGGLQRLRDALSRCLALRHDAAHPRLGGLELFHLVRGGGLGATHALAELQQRLLPLRKVGALRLELRLAGGEHGGGLALGGGQALLKPPQLLLLRLHAQLRGSRGFHSSDTGGLHLRRALGGGEERGFTAGGRLCGGGCFSFTLSHGCPQPVHIVLVVKQAVLQLLQLLFPRLHRRLRSLQPLLPLLQRRDGCGRLLLLLLCGLSRGVQLLLTRLQRRRRLASCFGTSLLASGRAFVPHRRSFLVLSDARLSGLQRFCPACQRVLSLRQSFLPLRQRLLPLCQLVLPLCEAGFLLGCQLCQRVLATGQVCPLLHATETHPRTVVVRCSMPPRYFALAQPTYVLQHRLGSNKLLTIHRHLSPTRLDVFVGVLQRSLALCKLLVSSSSGGSSLGGILCGLGQLLMPLSQRRLAVGEAGCLGL